MGRNLQEVSNELQISDELAEELYSEGTGEYEKYRTKLIRMEIPNPSLSRIRSLVKYKTGVDFMTNQPTYKMKNGSIFKPNNYSV